MIGEVKFFYNSTDQTTGAYATADGASHRPVSNVLDNTSASWQHNASYPHWLKLTLPTARDVTGYTITSADQPTFNPTAWTLSYSDDDTNWTVFDTRSDILFLDFDPKLFEFPLATLNGKATIPGNTGVEQVVIRRWTSKELLKIVVPASNGDWTTTVPLGTYDITYFATNCQPICHGPYIVTA